MSETSENILSRTSKGKSRDAYLVLEDGTSFKGRSCGARGEVFGEVCFNTSMEGYLEVVTDPSYANQIAVMTYPQIGNYGVSLYDVQRGSVALKGLVCRDVCTNPSSWRSDMSLPDYLRENGIVAIEGIDTRALVRHLRDNGLMQGAISTEDADMESLLGKVKASEHIVGTNSVKRVSCTEKHAWRARENDKGFALKSYRRADPRFKVVAYDCGVKDSILENLERIGADITVVPWDMRSSDVLELGPDGVFLSNGPGDPDAVCETYSEVEKLVGKVPIFGICLGHQMLSKSAGADMVKLKFGHRGANQPVMNLITGRVEITAQNHGFNQDFSTLGGLIPELSDGIADHVEDLRLWARRKCAPVVMNARYGRIQLTHVNLNDGTAEGMAFLDVPAFSVQYHPEASPGPTDSHYLFEAFANLMDGRSDYLDISTAEDRLRGWKF